MPDSIGEGPHRGQSLPGREVLEVPQKVTHTQASAGGLAGVGGSDSLLGRPNAVNVNKEQPELNLEHIWIVQCNITFMK